MKRWKHLTIGRKLIIAVFFITLVSSLLMVSIFLDRMEKNLSNEIEEKLLATTQRYAISFESNLNEVQKIGTALENEFIRRLGDKPLTAETINTVLKEMEAIVETLAQNSDQGRSAYIYIDPAITGYTHDVFFADQDGDGLVERQMGIPKTYYRERPSEEDPKDWWYGPKNTGLPYWTAPYNWVFDNGQQSNFVSHTRPIYIRDQFIGIVGSDLLFDEIVETITNITVNNDGFAYLIGREQDILICSEDTGLALNEMLIDPVFIETLEAQSKEIRLHYFSQSENNMISAVVSLANRWYFGLVVYEASIFSEFDETVNFVIFMILLIACLNGSAFYLVGQSITRPIIQLAEYVDEISHDDYETVSFIGDDGLSREDEIGHLRQAIQMMIEKIRHNMSYIHHQNDTLKDQMEKNEAMRKKLELAFEALSSAHDGIVILDKDLSIIYYNQLLLQQFSLSEENIIDGLMDLFPSNRRREGIFSLKQWHIRRSSGSQFKNYKGTLHEIGDEGEIYLIIFRDITSDVHQRNRLEEIKEKDLLTGLYNRFGFEKAVVSFLNAFEEAGGLYPLMLINIDQFRSINDSIGFQKANEFLKKIAQVLSEVFREECIVSRTNGDEFGVFIKRNYREQDLEAFLQKQLQKIGKMYEIDQEKVYFNFSVGVSIIGMDSKYCNDGMNNAHSALNFAKDRKNLQVAFFNREMLKMTIENYQMVRGLREAIDAKAFEVVYQPKWDVLKQRCVGLEALARWRWNGAYIRPDIFIKVAEYNNMMLEIGEIIFEKSVSFIRTLSAANTVVPVSVNVSGIQFSKGYLEQYVTEIIDIFGIEPDWLEIELTESILMNNYSEANGIISSLKKKGIHAAIDDFGKGYSSLSYLKNFEVNTLKIDRDFIKDIPQKDDGLLAQLIINLSNMLDFQVVAEGVETEAQKKFLEGLGCHVIQGYYISKPLTEEETLKWLAEKN